MSKNKDMANQLAALRKQAVNDDPHEAESGTATATPPPEAPKAKPPVTKSKPKPKTSKPQSPPVAGRERTAVNLTPSAVDALKKVQAFLITDCGGTSASASAAMCIALKIAAKTIHEKPDMIVDLFEEVKQADGRRKTS